MAEKPKISNFLLLTFYFLLPRSGTSYLIHEKINPNIGLLRRILLAERLLQIKDSIQFLFSIPNFLSTSTNLLCKFLLRVCKFYKQVFTPWSFTVNNGLVLKKVAMVDAEHGDI